MRGYRTILVSKSWRYKIIIKHSRKSSIFNREAMVPLPKCIRRYWFKISDLIIIKVLIVESFCREENMLCQYTSSINKNKGKINNLSRNKKCSNKQCWEQPGAKERIQHPQDNKKHLKVWASLGDKNKWNRGLLLLCSLEKTSITIT